VFFLFQEHYFINVSEGPVSEGPSFGGRTNTSCSAYDIRTSSQTMSCWAG